ncbi:hypothetical protein JCM10908_002372 [Rhodotorula pacifica]|uniref:uncharacterized protein n=1 Tax=Rhodotorula pacifica TaxID=1495444 RepID=UPI00316B0570
MSTERTRTSLLSLPDELLDKVVHELFDGYPVYVDLSKEACAVALICRRLRPLVEQRVYHRLDYGGDRKLLRRRLNKFEKRPELRALVRLLEFRHAFDDDDDSEYYEINNTSYPGSHKALSQFPGVRTLILHEAFPADIANVLGGSTTRAHPNVRRLKIKYMARKENGVHKAVWWNSLSRLPNLEEFTLAPVAREESTVLAFDTSEVITPVLSVYKLEVTTNINLADDSPDISTLFPNLIDFRIRIEGPWLHTADIDRLLHTAPSTLHTLRLDALGEIEIPLLRAHLERFSKLKRLYMSEIESLDEILPAIQSSSISLLQLACSASDKFLLGLVDGPTRMKHLEALQLDLLGGPNETGIQPLIAAACRDKRDGANRLARLKEDYAPPWPPGASEKGLGKAVDVARSHGIKVSGWVLPYIGWEERWDREVESCLVDATLAEGDWTVIEEYLGKDEATKAVQRRQGQAQVEVDGESAA